MDRIEALRRFNERGDVRAINVLLEELEKENELLKQNCGPYVDLSHEIKMIKEHDSALKADEVKRRTEVERELGSMTMVLYTQLCKRFAELER
jgi:hypothetical protein